MTIGRVGGITASARLDSSIVGLAGVPMECGTSVAGPLMGPAALRTAGLPAMLSALGLAVADYGDLCIPAEEASGLAPGDAARCRTPDAVAGWVRTLYDQAHVLAETGFPLFLGGDHALSMGTIAGIARRCNEARRPLAVIWVDAHADFNTPATSPSGNIHGMALACLAGDPALAPILGDRPLHVLDPALTFLFGVRSVDAGERRRLVDAGIDVTDMRMLDERGIAASLRRVLAAIPADAHIHLSFDADCLDPDIAVGVGTPVPGGLTWREAHLVMEMLHDDGRIGSADIVELNPFLDDRGRTARIVAELVASLFGRTVLARTAA